MEYNHKMFTQKLLINLLGVVGNVTIHNYNKVHALCHFIGHHKVKKKIIILEKKWGDKFKNDNEKYYPLDIYNIENWITYDSCLRMEVSKHNNTELKVIVNVYNGRITDGYSTDLKWTATLIIPYKFVKIISNEIMYKVEYLSENAYELHLENKKNTYKRNFIDELIELNK